MPRSRANWWCHAVPLSITSSTSTASSACPPGPVPRCSRCSTACSHRDESHRDELLEEELVLEERDVVLVPRERRQQLRGLEQTPAVLERVQPGLVWRDVAVTRGRVGRAGS